jgi:type IV pilus assembly protein PilO
MNSQLQKQLLIGGLAGVLVAILIYVFLGGMRSDLSSLQAANAALKVDVDKGYAIKANYEKLKNEVTQQEKVIEDLIKIMPTDADRGEIPYRIKKLADTAGIEQVSFTLLPPLKQTYYTEYPVQFTFRGGYHTFGQFTSLVSGYEKIINITDLNLRREGGKSLYPVLASFKVSAFVYNPAPPPVAPAPGKKAAVAGGVKKDSGD